MHSSTLDVQPGGVNRDGAGEMRAMVLPRYGAAEQLTLRKVARPRAGDEQVVIRVHAASINPIDWKIRKGWLRLIRPARFPLVLGFDIAGEVDEVGAAAASQGWKVGDAVYCFSDQPHGGGYAEYVAVSADVLARRPPQLSFAEAASVPLAACTALQALRDIGGMQPGDSVLVNGASGGVGTFAVQIASTLGARVTAVCGRRNLELVKQLGAHRVLDYHEQDFTRLDETFDVIFDAVAKSSFMACRQRLKPAGCYINTLPTLSTLFFHGLTRRGRRRCRFVLVRPKGADLQFIGNLIEEGRIRPVVDTVFSMTEIVSAHQASEAGHTVGKLALRW